MMMLHQPKTPDAIDILVGNRIRLQRALKGISQTALAQGLGVTFQQVQKYEKGTNRVSSSRLQATADILGVPVAFFFEQASGGSHDPQKAEIAASAEIVQFLKSAEGVALNRAFLKIQNGKIRGRLVDLVKTLAKGPVE